MSLVRKLIKMFIYKIKNEISFRESLVEKMRVLIY